MKKLVTISREYGSGGRIIGKILAEKLGVPFYDKEIIDMAVQESGFSRGDNLFYIGRSATISYTRFAATDKSINKL